MSVVDCLVPAAIRIPLLALETPLYPRFSSLRSSLFRLFSLSLCHYVYSLPILRHCLSFPDISEFATLLLSRECLFLFSPFLFLFLLPSWLLKLSSFSSRLVICATYPFLFFVPVFIIFNFVYIFKCILYDLSKKNEFFHNKFLSPFFSFFSILFRCFYMA